MVLNWELKKEVKYKLETITLHSSQVYLAEDNSNPDSYIAKFIICDFGRNKNGVAINRRTIDNWLYTLKNKPLVGKIKIKYDGTYDFTSHNMKVIKKTDENGMEYQEVIFDTDAFGTFFDISIETINDIECIVASCEIWKRFPKACEIIISRIKEGTLHTSWEIAIEKSEQGIIDGLMTKIIDAGRFLGHCLLSKDVSPAYDTSGLLEIASTDYDVEFASAISQDILSQGLDKSNKQKKEDCILNKDVNNIVTSKEGVEDVPENGENSTEKPEKTPLANGTSAAEPNDTGTDSDNVEKTEISTLTDIDLRDKVERACRDKIDKWCYVSFLFPEDHEVWCTYDGSTILDMLKFTYSVDDDKVTVSDPENVVLTVSVKDINTRMAEYEKTIAEKDELIIKSCSEITSLKSENTELSQYKDKFTKLEQEKVEAELSKKREALVASVIKSGQITREEIEISEELSGFVNNLDKASLMRIIGERLIASIDKKVDPEIETSESISHVVTNLNNEDDDEEIDKASIMRKFLGK